MSARLASGIVVLRTMVIISKYHFECNSEEREVGEVGEEGEGKVVYVESDETSYCPICNEPLSHRDRCVRYLLREGRERETYSIPRGKCNKCGKTHRLIPDFMTPFKQYATEVISGVLENIIQATDEDSADYPCEMTMRRWHRWMLGNRLRIDGYLKSLGYRLLGFSEDLLKTSLSLFDRLQAANSEWLETVLRFVYNSGGFLVPV